MVGEPARSTQGHATIWQKVSEDTFRRDVVTLEERTNAVPVEPQVFPDATEHITDSQRRAFLPVSAEQQVANHLACLAAVQEGAQSVAAVCLEQYTQPSGLLRVRIAAADAIDDQVRRSMSQIMSILMCVSKRDGGDDPADQLLDLIIGQHQCKILGRLRSRKWVKPRYLAASHKKPLWQDFDNVIHRAQHVYPKRGERPKRQAVENSLKALAACYQAFEDAAHIDTELQLKLLIKSTEEFCKISEIREFAKRLEQVRPTAQIAAALKSLRQLEKIGAYWKIAKDLVAAAATYHHVFGDIELTFLRPYASVATSIAYESWASTCHVHAEIQLLVFYDLWHQQQECQPASSDVLLPTVIGTSKYLCYLCYLFIKCHGKFLAANTHGRLYDQWTVPDLAEYDERTKTRYADALAAVHEIVCKQAEKEPCWRAEPMTSRQNLLFENEVVS